MADAINDLATCSDPAVTKVAAGQFWAIHQQGEKIRFDVWSEDESLHRCWPMRGTAHITSVVQAMESEATRTPKLRLGIAGLAYILSLGRH